MNKRGESETSLSTNEVIGLVLTFLFILIIVFILGKALLSRGCPAGYDLIESSKFNPSIEKICGEKDASEKITCCVRKSDPLQVCKYYRSEKRLDCNKLTEFNFFKVCSDNTACGVSTNECSGGYCEKGLCLVKDGIGRCVERFELDGKDIIVNKDSCERDFDGVSVGNNCQEKEGRHCVFNSFTRKGKCSGAYFSVDIEDAKKECERYCYESRDMEYPLNSEYCTAKFPIKVKDKLEPVNYNCYSDPINVKCSVQCKQPEQIPQL